MHIMVIQLSDETLTGHTGIHLFLIFEQFKFNGAEHTLIGRYDLKDLCLNLYSVKVLTSTQSLYDTHSEFYVYSGNPFRVTRRSVAR